MQPNTSVKEPLLQKKTMLKSFNGHLTYLDATYGEEAIEEQLTTNRENI